MPAPPLQATVGGSNQHADRMAELIEQMWSIPAKTEAADRPEAWVAISLDWRDPDEQVGWRVKTTRRLLADLVGGDAGRNMREQFASCRCV
jgi:hypothetical protein